MHPIGLLVVIFIDDRYHTIHDLCVEIEKKEAGG